jgi:hypothetical protein
VRTDSAFFSDRIVSALDQADVEYAISVPFDRFTQLKAMIEHHHRWYQLDQQQDYFESNWKPKSWNQSHRFIFVLQQVKEQYKEPVQRDLFIPYEYGYAFKVVLTNKDLTASRVVAVHNGRSSQKDIFAELKSNNALSYVPTRTWRGNQVYM